MSTQLLLLRGINVGGRNRLPMSALRSLVAHLGCTDVATYLQSGNVVCTGPDTAAETAASVAAALEDDLGLRVPVVGREASEWADVVAGNPLADLEDDAKKLHVTFLDGVPDPERVSELAREVAPLAPERLEVVGTHVFLHCPGGYSRTPLSNTFLERRLQRRATTRNWRTVIELAQLAGIAA